MGLNRKLRYTITGIDYWVVKPTANRNKDNAIIIEDVYDNGDGTVDIELLFTAVSDSISDYMRAHNGQITVQIGNMYSGHNRIKGFRSENNKSVKKRDPQKYLSHHFVYVNNYSIRRPSNTLNSTWSYTLTVDKCCLTRNKDIGDTDKLRTKCSAQEAINNWKHVIYKVRFRYMTEEDKKRVLNSDEIDVYCTFDGWEDNE